MRVCLRHGGLDFRHRDHGEKTDKEQEQRSENPERADVGPDVHPRRMKHSPRRWQEIADQTTSDDDEALEPHAGVNAHRDEENDQHVATAPAEPKQLWREAIAKEHPEPPIPPVGTEMRFQNANRS